MNELKQQTSTSETNCDESKTGYLFSIIADEVVEVANKEQLSLCLQFVNSSGVHEILADFVEVERITGAGLADAILQRLAAWGLPLSCLCGQCYDDSSNMSGIRSRCRTLVQNKAPKATYTHCAAHQLHVNLAVVLACNIQAFKNAESIIGEIARFFQFSSKGQWLLDKALEVTSSKSKTQGFLSHKVDPTY